MTQSILLQMPQLAGKNRQRKWINSYVLKASNFPGKLFEFKDYQVDREKLGQVIKSNKKVFLEIGSGSGGHLIEVALKNPEGLFFGFELRYKRSVRTLEKAQKINLSNLHILHIDGRCFNELFDAQSISGVYVNFPDPWEKKSQLKHRLLNEKFFKDLYQVLNPRGFFSFKTDHQEYYQTVLSLLENDKNFLVTQQTDDLYSSEHLDNNIATEFEKLFCSKGQPIYYLKIEKISRRG